MDAYPDDTSQAQAIPLTEDENYPKLPLTVGVDESTVDCAICLESAVFPVELPCRHSFCYLCVKGTAVLATQEGRNPRCSICRSDIPIHVLSNPPLKGALSQTELQPSDEYLWYYECRSGGWWQFEERQKTELERAFQASEDKFKLLIAGQVFEIDLEQMIQYRPSSRHIIRRIKRDLATSEKRGIAGIRINSNPSGTTSQSLPRGSDSMSDNHTTLSATALLGPAALTAISNGELFNENDEAAGWNDLPVNDTRSVISGFSGGGDGDDWDDDGEDDSRSYDDWSDMNNIASNHRWGVAASTLRALDQIEIHEVNSNEDVNGELLNTESDTTAGHQSSIEGTSNPIPRINQNHRLIPVNLGPVSWRSLSDIDELDGVPLRPYDDWDWE